VHERCGDFAARASLVSPTVRHPERWAQLADELRGLAPPAAR
jgi:hypothetical protein